MSTFIKRFLICTAAGAIVAGIVAWTRGVFSAQSTAEALMALSDGFFVSGALMLGTGGIMYTFNGGAFDGLAYAFKNGIGRLKPGYEEDMMSFQDYRGQREAKAKPIKHFLLAGAVHAAVCILFYAIYEFVR